MSRNIIETVMGAVVLVVAAVFLFFAYSTSQVGARRGGYEVSAVFPRVDGIRDGGDVRLNGIKVGSIVTQTLDPKTYAAIVRMTIDAAIKLPKDSIAQIRTSGLLGDKYLAIVPGGDDQDIPPGGQLARGEPGFSLEDVVGQLLFSVSGGPKKEEGGASPPK
jgi:phospholipid/cholesterol/gamma-HCH transport system substrate-binding protein